MQIAVLSISNFLTAHPLMPLGLPRNCYILIYTGCLVGVGAIVRRLDRCWI